MLKNLTNETVKKYIPEAVSILYFPLTLIYLEIALKIKAAPNAVTYWLPALLFSAAFGILIGAFCLMIRSKTARYIAKERRMGNFAVFYAGIFVPADNFCEGTCL